ncbi:MAG: hypothetical protein DRI44_01430 [Chlamydiae bacterium]|nr:MAG: hypothetical protein DRI44_01430 [Chlamydiota bacterium]
MPKLTIACYYFPNYHPNDARNCKLKGNGWAEWELVKSAKPRFEKHHQPNIPLWGYTDEADPEIMSKKIDAAVNHGIDTFIFDTYYYNDGSFLERALDEGFLNAPNNSRIKFALMWANHDWLDIHPYKKVAPVKILYPGIVTKKTFELICDTVIEKYFKHPSYWKINGCPYFSIYELNKLMESFGSIHTAAEMLELFRDKVKKAGFPDLHLNAIVWGNTILPGETQPADPANTVKTLGFNSVTSYVWIHHVALPEMQTDYLYVQKKYFEYWEKANIMFDVPYFPNVTMGWDSSPRAFQEDKYDNSGYPFMNTISGNTPERFREALFATKEKLLENEKSNEKILTINCWNEWTEGSYLEPDTINKYAYLEGVKSLIVNW